jgi:hypothetical protein
MHKLISILLPNNGSFWYNDHSFANNVVVEIYMVENIGTMVPVLNETVDIDI